MADIAQLKNRIQDLEADRLAILDQISEIEEFGEPCSEYFMLKELVSRVDEQLDALFEKLPPLLHGSHLWECSHYFGIHETPF